MFMRPTVEGILVSVASAVRGIVTEKVVKTRPVRVRSSSASAAFKHLVIFECQWPVEDVECYEFRYVSRSSPSPLCVHES